MGELASLGFPGLFPEIEPRTSGMLRLDALHSMYWEESGSPDGIPAVFLHGGPGAGSTPKHRRFFDPGAYRIIVYDQRGAGRAVSWVSSTRSARHTLFADNNFSPYANEFPEFTNFAIGECDASLSPIEVRMDMQLFRILFAQAVNTDRAAERRVLRRHRILALGIDDPIEIVAFD